MKQKVETFTVAVLDKVTGEPIGTGFVISDTLAVTAYHVVANSLRLPTGAKVAPEAHVPLSFPIAGIRKEAMFVPRCSSQDADIAILHVDELPELVEVALLGSSEGCAGDQFVSAGYRKIYGGAVGVIAPPELEPTRAPYPRLILRSDQIDKGMSGAPVLDIDQDRVVGIVVSTWYSDPSSGKDRETSFAAPAEVLIEICESLELVDPLTEVGYKTIQSKGTILENLPPRRAKFFVDRNSERETIINLLEEPGARVLICGTGGMGKTTLALEVGHSYMKRRRFEVIIWTTTEYGGDLTLDRLLNTIAEVFCFHGYMKLLERRKDAKIRQLLRSAPSLLIIDGFECIKGEKIRDFIPRLPRQCRVLITSRRLQENLREEPVILHELSKSDGEDLMRVHSQGKRLERAASEVLQNLHEACGGMPLALEWAVGQINAGRQTIQGAVRDLSRAKAHAIYGALFEDSYNSLLVSEKKVLEAIAVSIGTVSKGALMYVAELSDDGVRAALRQLINMSLVYENGEFEDEKVRFSVHPLLANFVRDELSKHPSVYEKLNRRYIRYFSDLVEHSEYDEIEVEDIRATLDWCKKHNPERLIELVYALSYYFFNYGFWQERIIRGHQALEISRKLGNVQAEAWMLINELGYMKMQQGDYDAAADNINEGLRVVKDKTASMSKVEIVADLKDKLGFHFMMGLAFRYLGILSARRSHYTKAGVFFKQALEIFENLQRRSIIANQKVEMAECALGQGDYENARLLYQESLAYHSQQKEAKPWVIPWMARAYRGLGDIEFHGQRVDEARQLYGKAMSLLDIRHNEYEIARVQFKMALADEKKGHYESALELSKKALQVFARLGTVEIIDDVPDLILRLKRSTQH